MLDYGTFSTSSSNSKPGQDFADFSPETHFSPSVQLSHHQRRLFAIHHFLFPPPLGTQLIIFFFLRDFVHRNILFNFGKKSHMYYLDLTSFRIQIVEIFTNSHTIIYCIGFLITQLSPLLPASFHLHIALG